MTYTAACTTVQAVISLLCNPVLFHVANKISGETDISVTEF